MSYMTETGKKLKIEISGVFANQVRQMAQIMGITHEAVIQMSVANFANAPFTTMNTPNVSIHPTTPNLANLGDSESNIEITPTVDNLFDLNDTDSDWAFLHRDELNFNLIKTGPSTQPEEDYLLWGQFSRFLPIKFTLRVLAWCELRNNHPVTIQEWSMAVRTLSPFYRLILRELDLAYGTRRGEQMASGFPKDTEKSTERFTRHFCADIYSDGKMVGLPSHLGLITNDGDRIQFTAEGLAYVEATNPLIDKAGPEGRTIGADEETILLSTILNHLPSEWKFMIQVRDWIDEGFNTPTLLEGKIKQIYGRGTPTDWNENQIPTYRGGVIGRLGELCLITREWKFRSVTYQKSGEQFLQEVHNGGRNSKE